MGAEPFYEGMVRRTFGMRGGETIDLRRKELLDGIGVFAGGLHRKRPFYRLYLKVSPPMRLAEEAL
jgi:hypothetical protein